MAGAGRTGWSRPHPTGRRAEGPRPANRPRPPSTIARHARSRAPNAPSRRRWSCGVVPDRAFQLGHPPAGGCDPHRHQPRHEPGPCPRPSSATRCFSSSFPRRGTFPPCRSCSPCSSTSTSTTARHATSSRRTPRHRLRPRHSRHESWSSGGCCFFALRTPAEPEPIITTKPRPPTPDPVTMTPQVGGRSQRLTVHFDHEPLAAGRAHRNTEPLEVPAQAEHEVCRATANSAGRRARRRVRDDRG